MIRNIVEREVPFLMSRHPFPHCPNSLIHQPIILCLLQRRKRMPTLFQLLIIMRFKLQLRVQRQNRCINHLLMATFISTGIQKWLERSRQPVSQELQPVTTLPQLNFQRKEPAKAEENSLHSCCHQLPQVRAIIANNWFKVLNVLVIPAGLRTHAKS